MNVEEIVDLILSSRQDLTREDVLKAIEKKKTVCGGLLTEEAAARLVAAEYGVEVRLERQLPKMNMRQLISGLNDVTVFGRVLLVNALREYLQHDRSGQMAKLLIGDETGIVAVVLWDDKAGLVEKIKPRQVVRVTHGYARNSRDGNVELHVGKRGDVQISPPDLREDDFPRIEDFCIKIATIGGEQKRVIVEGVIQATYPVATFKRRDGEEGKVLRTMLEDDTGQIPIVFWNEKADDVASLHEGAAVLLVNAKLRRSRRNGTFELHVEDLSSVERLAHPKGFLRIVDLGEGMSVASIMGIIATKPYRREVTTRSGEKVSVASFELEDSSGRVWVSAWRKHVESVEGLAAGVRVRLKDVFVRRGFGEQLEISTRASSVIEGS